MTRRFTDFAPGDAILPNDVLLFSDAQYRREQTADDDSRRDAAGPGCRSIHRPGSSGRRSGRCATIASNIFRPACCISSTAALPPSRRIPTAARPATRSRKPSSRASSNWWNAMPTRSGGTTDRSGRRSISSQFDDSYVRDLQAQFADTGRKLWVLDVTSDLGVPTYVAILHWMQNGQENIEFGSGAHFDPAHCHAARADRTQPVPVDRPDGRRDRREAEPRRHHSVAPAGLSVSDAEQRTGAARLRLGPPARSTTRASRSTPASISPGAPATISSCSTRRGPTSRSRSSG